MKQSTAIDKRSQDLNSRPNNPNDLAQHSSALVMTGGRGAALAGPPLLTFHITGLDRTAYGAHTEGIPDTCNAGVGG